MFYKCSIWIMNGGVSEQHRALLYRYPGPCGRPTRPSPRDTWYLRLTHVTICGTFVTFQHVGHEKSRLKTGIGFPLAGEHSSKSRHGSPGAQSASGFHRNSRREWSADAPELRDAFSPSHQLHIVDARTAASSGPSRSHPFAFGSLCISCSFAERAPIA